jgi:hypothetical protein
VASPLYSLLLIVVFKGGRQAALSLSILLGGRVASFAGILVQSIVHQCFIVVVRKLMLQSVLLRFKTGFVQNKRK